MFHALWEPHLAWSEPGRCLCGQRAPWLEHLGESRSLLGVEWSLCTSMNGWSSPDTVFFCIIHQEVNLAQAPAVMRKISFLGWSLHWQPVISLLAGRVGVVLQGLLNFSRCLEVAVPVESTTFGALCALPKWNLLQAWDWDWQGVGEQLWCSSKAKCCPFCIICKNMLSGREIQLALCHLPPPQRVLEERA